MDFDTINGGPLAAIVIVVLIMLLVTGGSPDLVDALICNLMDTCADWQPSGEDAL